MSKKKVLFVGSFKEITNDGHVGGQHFACRTLINSELSNSVEWFLVDSTSPSVITPPFYQRMGRAISRFIKFSFFLFIKNPDGVLIFTVDGFGLMEKGSMALLAKGLGKRVIIAPRSGLIPRDLANSKLLSRFIPFVFKRCDFVICQSIKWKLFFEEHMKEHKRDKLVVIENWIDTNKEYNPTPKGNELLIIFLGWIEETKGVFDLYEGFKQALETSRDLRLQYAGKGSALNALIEMVKTDGLEDKVDFLGWVTKKEKTDLLNRADVFVLPSYFEGYPNSLLEAMLFGKACIATRVGSVEDVIMEKENGFLMEIGEIEKISATLVRLSEDYDLLSRVGRAAREKVLRDNSISSATSKFEKLL